MEAHCESFFFFQIGVKNVYQIIIFILYPVTTDYSVYVFSIYMELLIR